MTYLPRRLRKPNTHPGRVITVYNDRLSPDDLAAVKARYLAQVKGPPALRYVDARLAVQQDEPEHRPESILLWLAGVLILLALAAVAMWLR